MSATVLNTLVTYDFNSIIPVTLLSRFYYYLYFTEEGIEKYREELAPNHKTRKWRKEAFSSGNLYSKSGHSSIIKY